MPRPLRNTEPNVMHLLSTRTLNSELLLVPSPEMNNLIGGIIAKYSQKYTINIFGLSVLSNHYHILASSLKEGGIALFEENIHYLMLYALIQLSLVGLGNI